MNIVRLFFFSMITAVYVVLAYPGYYPQAGTKIYADYYRNPLNHYLHKQDVNQGLFHGYNDPLYAASGLYGPLNPYLHKPQLLNGLYNPYKKPLYGASPIPPPAYGVPPPPYPPPPPPPHPPPSPPPPPRGMAHGVRGEHGVYGGYEYGYGYGLPAESGGIFGSLVTVIGGIFLLFVVIMTFGYIFKGHHKHGDYGKHKPHHPPGAGLRPTIIIVTDSARSGIEAASNATIEAVET